MVFFSCEHPVMCILSAMTKRHLPALIFTGLLGFILGCDPGGESGSQNAKTPSELKAVVSTDRGDFTILLRPDIAPVAVANFVNLVENGFYHGKEVANANPASFSVGNTKPTPNYTFPAEFSPELLFDRPGIVAWTLMDNPAMVENSIPHPTRFFVTRTAQSPWNLTYPAFGEIVDGFTVLNGTQKGDWIRSIRIAGDPAPALAPYASQIATWNAAIEAVADPATPGSSGGIPIPEGTRPAGF